MCLTKAIKYIQDPAARVMIIRQSYPTLKLSGGLIDESKNIFQHFGGTYKEQAMKWVFDGTNGSGEGATIQFGAIPDNIAEWQGLQATHMLVDEAAEFTEQQILFLLSRLRSAKYKGHMCLMMTANPDINSFLMQGWVNWCLDPDTGIPKLGTEHITRYFVNLNGKMLWGFSEQELYEKYGIGKTLGKDFICKSFKYVPMTLYDNSILMKNDPSYLASLLAQPRVNQQRFLHGSWTARAQNSGMFNRDWVQIVDHPPTDAISRVRSWDLASSVPSEANGGNCDWSAGVKLSRDKFGMYYVEDVVRFQKLPDGVIKEIIKTSQEDGTDTQVTIPKDPGGAAKVANQYFVRLLAEAGVPVKSVVVSGHSSKGARFAPVASLAEGGSLRIVRGPYVEDFLRELEYFEPGNRNLKDDQVDALSDAFLQLCKSVSLPTFSIPTLQQASPIPTM